MKKTHKVYQSGFDFFSTAVTRDFGSNWLFRTYAGMTVITVVFPLVCDPVAEGMTECGEIVIDDGIDQRSEIVLHS